MSEEIRQAVADNYDPHLGVVLQRLAHYDSELVQEAWFKESLSRAPGKSQNKP